MKVMGRMLVATDSSLDINEGDGMKLLAASVAVAEEVVRANNSKRRKHRRMEVTEADDETAPIYTTCQGTCSRRHGHWGCQHQ